MSWYFETLDSKSGELVYTVLHYMPKASFSWFRSAAQAQLVWEAQRVWEESGSGVKFIKHINSDPEKTPVDLKEFFWIKLKSIPGDRHY